MRTSGVVFAVISALAFGSSGVLGKALIEAGLTPLQAVWLRISAAAVVLVAVALTRGVRRFVRACARSWRGLLFYGLAAVAAVQGLYFVAASRLPVGIAILLEFFGPVLVVGYLRLTGHPVTRRGGLGVVVALIGLAMVVRVWSGLRLDGWGLLAGLGAAAGIATYFLMIDRLADTVDPIDSAAAGLVVAAVALTVIARPDRINWDVLTGPVDLAGRTAPGWLVALLLVVVSTVLAYVTGIIAIHRLAAQVASGVAYLEAVSAAVYAWVLLGERLGLVQVAGGIIVCLGAFIAQTSTAVAPADEAGGADDAVAEEPEPAAWLSPDPSDPAPPGPDNPAEPPTRARQP